jgi:ABC-type spermidine/putrescine transport system permease subunit II
MDLPDVPTANELAEFVRSNSSRSSKFPFKRRWYEGMETWTEPEIRAVSDAAQGNTSIRDLSIDVAGLESSATAVIARIISQFRHVRNMWIRNLMRRHAEVPMARPHVVDAVLYGIMASKSSIEVLKLYGCCSPRAFRDFIE